MVKTKELKPMFEKTGDIYIDSSLSRIGRRISERQTFGRADMEFVEFVLENKLGCQICRSALLSLYLHIRSRKKIKCFDIAWDIMGMIFKNRGEIGIPEMKSLPVAFIRDPELANQELGRRFLSNRRLACAV
jgi:hypothetical protein